MQKKPTYIVPKLFQHQKVLKQQAAFDGWIHLHQRSSEALNVLPNPQENLQIVEEIAAAFLSEGKSSRCNMSPASRSFGTLIRTRSPPQEGSSLVC